MPEFYRISCKKGQYIFNYLFPEKQEEISVSLFMKGPLMRTANGDPSASFSQISGPDPSSNRLIAPKQVHGTMILTGLQENALPNRPEADGILLDSFSDLPGSLRFADCFPIIFSLPLNEPFLLIAHSGFKGTLRNIAGKAVSHLENLCGKSNLSKCQVMIGPGIGPCCYWREKDDPLTSTAITSFGNERSFQVRNKVYFDLAGVISDQCIAKGIPGGNIHSVDLCTCCNRDICYSYRAGDLKKRMFLLAYPPSLCQKELLWWENV